MRQQIFQTLMLFFGAILLTVGFEASQYMHQWSNTTSIAAVVECWNVRRLAPQLESEGQPITVQQILTTLRREIAASNDESVKEMLGSWIKTRRLPLGSWIKPTTTAAVEGAATYDFQSPKLHFSRLDKQCWQLSPIALNVSPASATDNDEA